jgi:hypothetical protein
MSVLLQAWPAQLYRPDDAGFFNRALQYQIGQRCVLPIPIPTWKMQAQKFNQIIGTVAEACTPA